MKNLKLTQENYSRTQDHINSAFRNLTELKDDPEIADILKKLERLEADLYDYAEEHDLDPDA